MTKRAITTQAEIRRMVRAAAESGLIVTGIIKKPDGTVLVSTAPLAPEQHQDDMSHDVVL